MAGLSEGFPAYTPTGTERLQADTILSGGRNPQTVSLLTGQIGAVAFGGVPGAATATGTGGTATATVTTKAGKITTGNITGVALQAITVTATGLVTANSIILCNVTLGTATVRAVVTNYSAATDSFVLTLATNNDTTPNMSGTYIISYVIIG